MKKKLPVGIEDFEEILSRGFYYADKTMLIADILNDGGKVSLFTRPRRFGKSLIISMLKTFFETGCDGTLFDGLKIERERELCRQHMGQYPVISITLKSVDGLTYESARAALSSVIGFEAMRFQFLADSVRLTAEEREVFRQLIRVGDGQKAIFEMSDPVLLSSLRTLCRLVEKHYGRKAILLIDEYDVPLDKAFQAGYYEEMISLLRGLFGNVLKTNESLYFAVLTGCLRISRESIFTGLNNLKVYTITDTRYDEYFGFTDADVDELLNFCGLTAFKDTIREWYDGYRFGEASVYCPWDVINYCDALLARPDPAVRPQNYWANTSGNAMVRRFISRADRRTKSEIEQLIAGECIVRPVNQELTYSELDSSIENLWSVLFTTGYLTQRGQADADADAGLLRLSIPNREIRSLFVSQIQTWFRETARADSGRLEQFCRAFPEGDTARIEEMLNDYLWNSISIRDTAVRKDRQENFYHGMLLGLLQYEESWETDSNTESGEGYSDILMIRTPERIGVVIEIKYAGDGDLERSCAEALRQIEEKRYDASLVRDGMKKIVRLGIAFCKKNCRVVSGG